MHIFKYIGDFASIPTQKYHLTFEAFTVLDCIAHKKETTLVAVAKTLGLSKSAIARQVTVLLNEGYIGQKTDTNDRRVKFLTLTAAGNRVHRNASADLDDRFHRWLEFFGGKDEALWFIRSIYRANERAIDAGFIGFESLHDKRLNANKKATTHKS